LKKAKKVVPSQVQPLNCYQS